MTYIISQPESITSRLIVKSTGSNRSLMANFFLWTKGQEKNHVGWVGLSVMLMAAVFFPLTLTIVLSSGANFFLIISAMVSLVLVVITNLAAMPTRYTIPALFLGILIDLAVIISSLMIH
jgi:hypothetical protein